MTPVCSIVIRAHNEGHHIGRLLTGISQQTLRDVQVILVDSGSTDDTLTVASHFQVQVVRIHPQDFTFGRSLNMGIAAAEAALVVIASAHVYPVYPDWLERLLAPFDNSRVALTYGKQRGGESSKFSEHQVFAHWFPNGSELRQDHPFCNNANAAIRRALWEKHPYNETIPGLEDLAWARWAHEQGHIITYVSEAEVVHVHNETWHAVYNRYRREGMAFKQIYPQENFHLGDLLRLFFSNAASDLQAAGRAGMRGVFWSVLRFRWNQFYGTYQGYRRSGPLTRQLKQAFYYPHNHIGGEEKQPRRTMAPIDYREKTP